jgi:hypothetical protein
MLRVFSERMRGPLMDPFSSPFKVVSPFVFFVGLHPNGLLVGPFLGSSQVGPMGVVFGPVVGPCEFNVPLLAAGC